MSWSLSTWSLFVGSLMAAGAACFLIVPGAARKAVAAFPRNAPAAWVLAAMNLIWISAIVMNAHLDRFDSWKPALYVVAPLCFFLLVKYLDELLAPRALGGLFLLLPNPILNAARWHPSDWRYVMIVLAYILVVVGILLVLGPYRFRRWMAWWIENDARARARGAFKLALGAAFIVLGLKVY